MNEDGNNNTIGRLVVEPLSEHPHIKWHQVNFSNLNRNSLLLFLSSSIFEVV
jgi:hypothetical protein